jgi:regulator of sirC expression with transglutaminase-like and TPR domain
MCLDHACSLMAAAFTGEYHYDRVMRTLDELAGRVEERSLGGVLAATRGRLTGDRESYFDARNSYIDVVLERGLGLPITLSVIVMEIGRRVDIPIVGIGLPSHFIVRDGVRDVFGDPFHDGAVYDRAAVVSSWSRLVGEGHEFDELHLSPVAERVILIRMLNNLRALYSRGQNPRALYALAVMRGAFVELAHESPEHARWVRHYN